MNYKSKMAAALFILLAMQPLWADDLETSVYFGNLGLPWGAAQELDSLQHYPINYWLYGVKTAFYKALGPGFFLSASYETDPVLKHIIRGVVSYESGIVSIEAGPMVGTFNNMENILKAGIHIGFRLDLPGIVFASAIVESSMGAGLISDGDYFQELADIKAGWYVYNAICSLSILTKRLTSKAGTGQLIVDVSTDYTFSADVHKKGSPYHINAELGYKAMTKTRDNTDTLGLGAIILGAELGVDINSFLTVNAGLNSGVYVFGTEKLAGKGPLQNSFMFSSSLGVVMHFPVKTVDESMAF